MNSAIMRSLTFTVSKKISTFKFLPCHTITKPAGQTNTYHYIDLHFLCESKTVKKKQLASTAAKSVLNEKK